MDLMKYRELKMGDKTDVRCSDCGEEMILLARRRGEGQERTTDLLRCEKCEHTVTYDPVMSKCT